MTTDLPPIERFYLALEKPLLVYQRHGGLIVVPFDLDGAPHVVTVRADPLTDAESVQVIPAYRHDPRATLAALVEALDAVRDVALQARGREHAEAVRLCERATRVVQAAAQAASDRLYTPHVEPRQHAKTAPVSRHGHATPPSPVRSRLESRAATGAWGR